MSADTASPSRGGVEVVGDRYRLIERISSDAATDFWRAHDELLARPVALTVHTPGGEAARDFLARAHRLSTLTHPAVTRVYDAVDEGGRAYVVSEWVEGSPLSQLLAERTLDPNDAAALVCRVAEAVAQAHAAGLAFGDVHPDHIHFSRRGTVFARIATGQASPAEDIRGLGALLYAALTGQWPLDPNGTSTGLRPASLVGGQLSTPRQVRAGVPHDLSTLAMRALEPDDPRGLRSAEAVVTVLRDRVPAGYADQYDPQSFAAPPEPEPEPYPTRGAQPRPSRYSQPEPYQYPPDDPYQRRQQEYRDYQDYPDYQRGYPEDYRNGGEPERRRSRAITVTAIAAGVLALALVGWLIGAVFNHVPSDSGGRAQHPIDLGNTPTQPSPSPSSHTITGTSLTPTGAQLFDPEGDGQDNPEDAGKTIDGDPSTSWSTVDYKHFATFGNLKAGMGVIIDLGKPTAVRQVTIQTTTPGIDLQVRSGDQPGGQADAYAVAGQTSNATSSVTIPITGGGEHRYWVVWITKLAPNNDGTFHATLAEVQFRQ